MHRQQLNKNFGSGLPAKCHLFLTGCPRGWLLFTVLFLAPCYYVAPSFGQGNITGKVVDQATSQPMPFASVFLDKTMLGGNTDANGNFSIKAVPRGSFELICTFIGYTPYRQPIRIDSLKTLVLSIQLKPLVTQLKEVVVRPQSDKLWRRQLKIFEDNLLGSKDNRKLCKLLNPYVLNFDEDPETKEFVATAIDLLRIENKALGYQYLYLLESFSLRRGYVSYLGKIKIEPLQPKNADQQREWENHRRETYRQSDQHFLYALAVDSLAQHQFDIYESIWFGTWGEEKKESRITESRNIWLPSESGDEMVLQFEHRLRVTYKGKIESQIDGQPVYQTSWLSINQSNPYFSRNGILANPLSLIRYGYWGKQGVADILPSEYSPE